MKISNIKTYLKRISDFRNTNRKQFNLLIVVAVVFGLILWWDGITPLTPLTKISSMEPVERAVNPFHDIEDKWPTKAWIKGRVVLSGHIGFILDDGTGTIGVGSNQYVAVGQSVVVLGPIGSTGRDGMNYPTMMSTYELHLVLFFPTFGHFFIFVFLVAVCNAVGLYWYQQKKKGEPTVIDPIIEGIEDLIGKKKT